MTFRSMQLAASKSSGESEPTEPPGAAVPAMQSAGDVAIDSKSATPKSATAALGKSEVAALPRVHLEFIHKQKLVFAFDDVAPYFAQYPKKLFGLGTWHHTSHVYAFAPKHLMAAELRFLQLQVVWRRIAMRGVSGSLRASLWVS
jgi:hypothetical protein